MFDITPFQLLAASAFVFALLAFVAFCRWMLSEQRADRLERELRDVSRQRNAAWAKAVRDGGKR